MRAGPIIFEWGRKSLDKKIKILVKEMTILSKNGRAAFKQRNSDAHGYRRLAVIAAVFVLIFTAIPLNLISDNGVDAESPDESYSVQYDANGGELPESLKREYYYPRDIVTVSFDPTPLRVHSLFMGWAFTSDAEKPDFGIDPYMPDDATWKASDPLDGRTFRMGQEDVTLYAIWKDVTSIIDLSDGNAFIVFDGNSYFDSRDLETEIGNYIEVKSSVGNTGRLKISRSAPIDSEDRLHLLLNELQITNALNAIEFSPNSEAMVQFQGTNMIGGCDPHVAVFRVPEYAKVILMGQHDAKLIIDRTITAGMNPSGAGIGGNGGTSSLYPPEGSGLIQIESGVIDIRAHNESGHGMCVTGIGGGGFGGNTSEGHAGKGGITTIYGGTIRISLTSDTPWNESTGIGGGSSRSGYASDSGLITVVNGTVDITISATSMAVSGAGIGGGGAYDKKSGGDATVRIDGGTIRITKKLTGPGYIIGAGIGGGGSFYASAGIGDVQINDGTVYVKRDASETGSNTVGAGIGGGGGAYAFTEPGGTGHVTVNGGNITVQNTGDTSAAAIGGGNKSNGYVNVNGGTITAMSPCDTIGGNGTGASYVEINGGTIKTAAPIIGAKDSKGNELYQMIFDPSGDVRSVFVNTSTVSDGQYADFNITSNHFEWDAADQPVPSVSDHNLYLYLPLSSTDASIETGGDGQVFHYDISSGTVSLIRSDLFRVEYIISGVTHSKDVVHAAAGETISEVLIASGEKLPSFLRIHAAGTILTVFQFTYDPLSGSLSIPDVKGKVTIRSGDNTSPYTKVRFMNGSDIASETVMDVGTNLVMIAALPNDDAGKLQFAGWKDAVTGTLYQPGSSYGPLPNRTESVFVAEWIDYMRISFDLNGGTWDIEDVYGLKGMPVTLPSESPSRDGYEFVEWRNARTGSVYEPDSEITLDRDTVLTAVWKGSELNVIFDLKGGEYSGYELTDNTVTVGSLFAIPDVSPIKAGHDFLGWTLDEAGNGTVFRRGGSVTISQTSDVTFYAKWSSFTTLATFDLGEGMGIFLTLQGIPGTTAELPEYGGRPLLGHTFAGWSLDAEKSETSVVFGDRNITYHALWEPRKDISVTFKNGDINAELPANLTGLVYGTTFSPGLPKNIPDGLYFICWNTEHNGDGDDYRAEGNPVPPEDITLYVRWGSYVSVVFYLAGGSDPAGHFDRKDIVPGTGLTIPAERPIRDGYNFLGWYEPVTGITYDENKNIYVDSNTILIAKWGGKDIQISYDLNGGTGSIASEVGKVGSSFTLSLKEPSREGFRFDGWSFNGSVYKAGFVFDVLSNVPSMVLIAVWSEYPTLAFSLNGGNADAKFGMIKLGPSETHVLEVPVRNGYKFIRWFDNAANRSYSAGEEISIERNTTLTAEWTGNEISISYNLAGGSGSGFGAVKSNVGSSFKIPQAEPKYTGHFFIGWSFNGSVYKAGFVFDALHDVSVMEFVAVWSEYPTLSFNLNGGNVSSKFDTISLGPGVKHTLAEPLRQGYKFVKWIDIASGTTYNAGEEISIERNTTLTATWVGNEINISYELGGGHGTVFGNTKGNVGSSFRMPAEEPVLEGHYFRGWSFNGSVYEAGFVFDTLQNVSSIVFVAVWSEYPTLSFSLNGGDPDPKFNVVTLGPDEQHTLKAPTRSGYTFLKWIDNATGTEYHTGHNMTIVKNTTLTAVWKGNEITISFDLNGGSDKGFDGTKSNVGSRYDVPSEIPSRGGYHFIGWSYAGTVYQPGFSFEKLPNTAEMKFVAVWSEYPTLSFSLNGGDNTPDFNTISLKPGEKYTLDEPVRSGYTFVKWIDNAVNRSYNAGSEISITKNTTLVAEWEGNPVTVMYDLNGGSQEGFDEAQGKVGSSFVLTGNVPIRSGYHFIGWSYANSVFQPGHEFEHLPNVSVMEFVAIWSEHPTLSFNLNGGDSDPDFNTISLKPGEKYTLDEPVRSGYTFVKWFDNAVNRSYNAGSEISITRNTTLTAVWEGNPVTVMYDLNGGSGEGFDEVQEKVGSSFALTSNVPVLAGHHFIGWSYANSVFQPGYEFEQLPNVPSMEFVAIWSEYPTLSFNLNGGDSNPDFNTISLRPGEKYTLDEPVRSGYTFVRWFDNAVNRSYNAGDEISIIGNTTLKAVWEGNEITISFDLNEGFGTGFDGTKSNVGSRYDVPSEIPSRSGYHFIGWSYAGTVYQPGFSFEKLPNTDEVEFVAVWSEYPTLSFNLNGGNASSKFDTISLGPGVKHTLAEPSRQGYKFVKWVDIASGATYNAGSKISITGNTTLKAVWEGNAVSVRYDLNGGSGNGFDKIQGKVGSSFALTSNIPVLAGHHFIGWSYARSVFQPGHVFEHLQNVSSMEFVAIWSEHPTLSFNLNGGNASSKFDTISLGPGVKHTLAEPLRQGYKFVKWVDIASGITYNAGYDLYITGNTTLTAVWEGNEITISFDLNEGFGTGFDGTKGNVGSRYDLSSEIPSRSGYHFIGWSYAGTVYQPGFSFEKLPNTAEMKFVAIWSEHPTLSFNLNGGAGSSKFDTISLGPGVAHKLDEPSRTGYGFVEWIDNATGERYKAGYDLYITGNTTLTAVWKGNLVEITYYVDSDVFRKGTGRVGSPYTVMFDIPEKEGHFFAGWSYTESVFQPGFVYEHLPNVSAVIFTALWSEYPTLSFNLNGGDPSPEFSTIVLESGAEHVPAKPVRSGYTFVKWINNATGTEHYAGDGISITNNTTLTAVWEGNPVTVIYDLNGASGEGFDEVQGKVGSSFALTSSVPALAGHHFIGWSYAGTVYQSGHIFEHLQNVSSMEFIAIWSEHPTLSFNLNGGNASSKFDTISLGPGVKHTLAEPSRQGYKFVKWVDIASGTTYNAGSEISITGNTTLKAVWEGNPISIRYDLDGGSGTAFVQTKGKVGSSFTILPDEPLKEGHFFTGWSYAGTVYQPGHEFEQLPDVSEIVFVAVWSEYPLLSFDLNGGNADAKFGTVKLGPGESKELDAPVRSGYIFFRWVDTVTGIAYSAGSDISIVRNTTLKAEWKGNIVSIEYDLNGGTGPFEDAAGKVGSSYAIPSDVPVRNGYYFTGWSYASSLFQPGHVFDRLPDVSEMAFVAVWSEYPMLSFNLNGGTPDQKFSTVSLGPGAEHTLAGPSRDGYRFIEWIDNATGMAYKPGHKMSIEGNTTLNAVWIGNDVVISYDLKGGSGTVFGNVKGNVGSSFAIPQEEPILDGHYFVGWSFNGSVYKAGSVFDSLQNIRSITFVAEWSQYPMLAFNLNGGMQSSEFDTVSLSPGVEYVLGEPSRTGYGFAEWVDNATGVTYRPGDRISIEVNTTLSAVWIGNDVMISYDLSGGSGTVFGSTTGNVGSVFGIPVEEPVLEGHHFAGWSFGGSVYEAGFVFDPLPNFLSVRFVATWSEYPMLSFDLRGGSGSGFDIVKERPGTDLTLPLAEPSRQGYTFGGWQDISTGNVYLPEGTISITVNTVLTAIWSGNTITVTYHTDTGDAPSSDVYTFDGSSYAIALPTETMVKPGHEFALWRDGNGNIYSPGAAISQFTSNTELTAVWVSVPVPESYTVMITILPGTPGGTFEYRIGNSDFVPYTDAVQVLSGDDITFRAISDQRSSFKQWTYNGAIITGDTITISGVTSSVSILAEFGQESSDYVWMLYLLLLILPVSLVIWAYRSKGQ